MKGKGKVIAPNGRIQTFKVRLNLIEPTYRQNLFESMLLDHPKMELASVPGQNKCTEAGTHFLDKAPASMELVSGLLTLYFNF